MDYGKERFCLLLLEPGEIYFEDFSVYYFPSGKFEEEPSYKKQKGRLKVCSKSIVFDPQDICHPIFKLPLTACSVIEMWEGALKSKFDSKRNVIHIESNHVTEMLEANCTLPYKFKHIKKSYIFQLNFVNADDCLPQINQLKRASTLPGAEQASMISAIAFSRQSRINFNTSWLEDLYEKIILETSGNKITPLVTNPGRILLTSSRLYFQPYNNAEPWPVLKIKLSNIQRVIKRRYLLRHVGLELYCSEQSLVKHLFLTFVSPDERNKLYDNLLQQSELKLEDTGQENMTLLWQNGFVSNYDYLLYINSLADRSFNDLTQYPVFPWVISDYTSMHLDLDNQSSYRDLTKPIGALNDERLERLKARHAEMPEPKFLYGSHYSTPGFVLYYLVRKMPQYMLCLQNGRFDHPDRMFNSIPDTWKNVTTNTSDFKESIPEFYDLTNNGDFLLNNMGLDFGMRQSGVKVGNVELPNWSKGPGDFISKMRDALESEYVSQNLHSWIDLIFGYKQRGEEADKADNVFYYLTYEGAIDLDKIKDINERYALEVQITEFGQIPKQIFEHPHPHKKGSGIDSELAWNDHSSKSDVNLGEDEIDGKESGDASANGPIFGFQQWNSEIDTLSVLAEHRLHKETVTDVCLSNDLKYVFSVAQDSLLKVYSLEDKKQLRSVNISHMALSSCFLMNDGKTIVLGSWDNYVYMYNVEYGKVLEYTMAHDDAVSDIKWINGYLATASWDSTAKIWCYEPHTTLRPQNTAELLAELDHDSGVNCLSLNLAGTLLVTGTCDGLLTLWDLASFSVKEQFRVHLDVVSGVAFSPDGNKILSGSKDQTLTVLDVETGTQLFNKNVEEEIRCLCWDGCRALIGCEKGTVQIWDLLKARLVKTVKAHCGPITTMKTSCNGALVVTGGEDKRVVVWKTSHEL